MSDQFLTITPLKAPTTATIGIPGSKSYTNRALIMAALTKGPVTLHQPLYSEDTETMIGSLRTLGLRIETFSDQIIVHDDISVVKEGNYELDANGSGSTLRFLLPLLCLIPGTKLLKGNARLQERPIEDLVDALHLLGARIEYSQKRGQPPLKINSSSLKKNAIIPIDPSMSSQFVSALLMVAPLLDGLTIYLNGLCISRPYLDMTIKSMREWGIDIIPLNETGFNIPSGQLYKQDQYAIEGDFSSAGYFFAIAALTQSTITLSNLNPNSIQADRKFLTILEKMGNKVSINDYGITLVGKQVLPVSLSMEDCPDQVQTMAVLAAFAKGTTRIFGVRSLRLKETERVRAIRQELAKMGIQSEETHDTLTIHGGVPHAASIDTYGDHRMAMAFAVAGTKVPGIQIENPHVVNKTFPTFWKAFGTL
jgi:3-phosphoshikimate 1-carboxyvinyltransferase